MTLDPSEVLNNRYRIIKLLGHGGFGAVYRAWDLNLQKACAVKENLDVSSELASQFMREATILANLAHPNLPRVIDHFSLPEHGQYLVMDFVEGENLETKVVKSGPVSYPQAVYWVGQIADALDYLHNQPQPLIHRDIKPANIIITPNGQAMLVDFGLVKIYNTDARTAKGARGITPGYSPPEQYGAGNTDARTDVYSLAATLYTLLSGTVPPESVDILAGIAKPPVAVHLRNTQVPAELGEAIQHAMQLDPKKRYPTAGEFKAALYAAIPTMSWGNMPYRAGQAPTVMKPQPGETVYANARPPSKPQSQINIASKTPSQPTPRKGLALFGIGGCAVMLVLLLLGAAGVWGLYTYTDALAFLKPATPTSTHPPTPTDTPIDTQIPPTYTPTPTELPTATPTQFPTEQPRSTPLPGFSDDFSDPNSGWDRVNASDRITDYTDGYYLIRVEDPNSDVWANPGLSVRNAIIEVDTTWNAGSFDNDFGIICRYQDTQNFYFGAISSDGFAGIIHMQNGSYNILGNDAMTPYSAIAQGDALNHIRFDCVGDTLTLYVNGQLLLTTTDRTISAGDIGLIAGTFDQGGIEILFDNFIAYFP